MIVLIEKHNAHRHPNLLKQMFQLRARVFCDRLGWDVRVAGGEERDRYDDELPIYLIYTDDEKREVKGSLRLLPTTGPTLLADLFSDTLPDAVHLSAPAIWECTRVCLDDRIVDKGQRLFASAVLIAALGDVAIRAGIEIDHCQFRCHDAAALPADRVRGRGPRLHFQVWPADLSGIVSRFRADPAPDKSQNA